MTMADDKSKRGKQDRAKIALKEDYEVRQVKKTTGASKTQIEKAVKEVGHGRKAVYEKLYKKK